MTSSPADEADAPDDAISADAPGDVDETASVSRRGGARAAVVVLAVIAVVIAAVVGFSVGRLSTIGTPTPANDSAEAGFLRDMRVHHDQGVELAFIVRDRSDSDDVRTLAYDIATTQGVQSGTMAGWLQAWGLPQYSSEPSMTWMTRPGLNGAGHSHGSTGDDTAHTPGEPMPGLATPEQIEELTSLTGRDAEVMFLRLMIAHHQGAIEMAEAILDRSTNPMVTGFARGIVESQGSEIDLMRQMLADRGVTDAS